MRRLSPLRWRPPGAMIRVVQRRYAGWQNIGRSEQRATSRPPGAPRRPGVIVEREARTGVVQRRYAGRRRRNTKPLCARSAPAEGGKFFWRDSRVNTLNPGWRDSIAQKSHKRLNLWLLVFMRGQSVYFLHFTVNDFAAARALFKVRQTLLLWIIAGKLRIKRFVARFASCSDIIIIHNFNRLGVKRLRRKTTLAADICLHAY